MAEFRSIQDVQRWVGQYGEDALQENLTVGRYDETDERWVRAWMRRRHGKPSPHWIRVALGICIAVIVVGLVLAYW
ncbi:hypothetical protein [Bordetella sp. 2513F-2]